MRRLLLLIPFLALLLAPTTALAQESTDSDDVILRINGPVTVPAGESVDSVFGVRNVVTVDGVVENTLWVIDGDAVVNGRVEGDVLVVDGKLTLGPQATVDNVSLVRGTLDRAATASITGELSERSEFVSFGWWDSALVSFVVWVGMTLLVLVAGLVFATIGARQLTAGGATLTEATGPSFATALILWIGLPILAIAAIVTLVGIPLGIAIFLVLLPALWFLGYLVAGARLGRAVLAALGRTTADRPVWATLVGLILFQVVALVPFIGGLAIFLAGLIGSGAMIYTAYRGRQERRPRPTVRAAEPLPAT